MKFFALKRTWGNKETRFKGVETPSQMRFVKYFEEIIYKYHRELPPKKMLALTKIVLSSVEISNT